MFGLLNIDKPAGMTSRDVVNRVQRLVRPHKTGHAGTLDPLATGVLIVAVGPATRLVEYVQRMPKTYAATFLLGRTSDTEDIDGQVALLPNVPIPTGQQVREVLPRFLGLIEQQPPAYSALKVAGQRAYKLARRGEEVQLEPRPVEIHQLELVRYEYPELELRVRCGSGSYVRSLGRDIARALCTGAVMAALRREAIGSFRAEDAVTLLDLSQTVIEQRLLPPLLALKGMTRILVTAEEAKRLRLGQSLSNRWDVGADELIALGAEDDLVAILARTDTQSWKAKTFPAKQMTPQQ